MDYFEQLKQDPERGRSAPSRGIRGGRPSKRIVQDIAPPQREAFPYRRHERAALGGGDAGRGSAPAPSESTEAITRSEFLRGLEAPRVERRRADAEEIAVKTWEPELVRKQRVRRRLIWSAATAAVAISVVAPTVAFPRFSVVITPKAETVKVAALTLLADTNAAAPDPGQHRMPAIEVSSEHAVTREYESSGSRMFRERSGGTVLVFNAFSSAPQPLVAQTRLQDSSGRIFRLRSAVTVPGATVSEGRIVPRSVTAEVLADEPGEAYNVGPSEFRIPGFRGTPKYEGFSAKSENAFSGGFVGEAKVVTSSDLERASGEVSRLAVEALGQDLRGKVPSDADFFTPEGGRELAVTRIDQPHSGDRLDRFSVTVNASGRMFAVRRSHLDGLLAALLLPDAGGLETLTAQHQPTLAVTGGRIGPQPGQMELAVSGELVYWRQTPSESLSSVLRASTPAKAEAYLRGREEIASIRIKRFPFWLWYIPDRPGGLLITFEPPA